MRAPARRSARRTPSAARGGTLLGVFIGIVIGIVIALAVALYVTGGWKVYQQQFSGRDQREQAKEPQKSAKAETEKPRFDFYKILPGGEEPKVQAQKPVPPDRATADQAAGKPAAAPDKASAKAPEKVASTNASTTAAKVPDRFWLQAGSFGNEADADNMKARLALAGWEAQVQKGDVPDKGVRYRVRLGPYDNTDELNRVKNELARRGFDVAVIRY